MRCTLVGVMPILWLLRGAICRLFPLVHGQGITLLEPPVVVESSSNGVLETTLTMEYTTINGLLFTLGNTRTFNGTIPGPTVRINPGDILKVHFVNQLESQPDTIFPVNQLSKADYTNLHFHGGHVSGEEPSDDVTLVIGPGQSYDYETQFPTNHMPGTHWIHPHLHGSAALQTASGAGCTLIVQDLPGYLPIQVEDATEKIIFVHHMALPVFQRLIQAHNDQKTQVSVDAGFPNDFRLVNGQYQPTTNLITGEWQRWRIIMAGWLVEELDFQLEPGSPCEMHLLAKDGIYIRDYPRSISILPIPAGGRADIMIRCNAAGTYHVLDYSGATLMTINVDGMAVPSTDLEPWTPAYPSYLEDLRTSPVNPKCSCVTDFEWCRGRRSRHRGRRLQNFNGGDDDDDDDDDDDGGGDLNDHFCINGELFDEHRYIHKMKYGEIIERTIRESMKHPYHQHVYPFQLVSTGRSNQDAVHSNYYKIGDWNDVLQINAREAIIRYKADVHTGLVMIHCHVLTHEDRGTMAQELVVENEDCSCSPFTIEVNEETGETNTVPSTSSGAAVVNSLAGYGWIIYTLGGLLA